MKPFFFLSTILVSFQILATEPDCVFYDRQSDYKCTLISAGATGGAQQEVFCLNRLPDRHTSVSITFNQLTLSAQSTSGYSSDIEDQGIALMASSLSGSINQGAHASVILYEEVKKAILRFSDQDGKSYRLTCQRTF